MAKMKDMLSIALGDEDEEDGLEYGNDSESEESAEDESVDAESAVIDDLTEAGFSPAKAQALVDAIAALAK